MAALAAAKSQLGTESARFAVDVGSDLLNYTGRVDGKTKDWEISGKEYVVRRVGTDLYVRASGKRLEYMMVAPATIDHLAAGGWVHTRLPHGRELSVVFNDQFPWNLAGTASRARAIARTGNRSFSGLVSVDESKYGVPSHTSKTMRISVDLDDRGRFTRISLGSDAAARDEHLLITFSDFGVSADMAPPPGDVVEEENPSFLSNLTPS